MGLGDAKIFGCSNVVILDSDNVFWDYGELWEIKKMGMTIENIATKMRALASEIGGNHHSSEEAQNLLNKLADELSEVNMNISIKLHDAIKGADGLLGIDDSYRLLYQRQKNIKENEDGNDN